MMREKRLPTPPPDYNIATRSPENRDSFGRRNLSGSSTLSNGAKRTAYGSGSVNGLREKVDVDDDLSIRLLAQSAMTEVDEHHIMGPEVVEDLKNVCPSFCVWRN